jgi:hypothetical protein
VIILSANLNISVPTEPNLVLKISDKDKIPFDKSGIYFLYSNDELLYIGKSQDLRKRILYSHLKGKDPATKGVYKSIQEIALFFEEDPIKRDILEIYFINKFQPVFNKSSIYEYLEEKKNIVTPIQNDEKWLPCAHIYAYKHLSQFKNIEHFNRTLVKFHNRYGDQFTKSELLALNYLQRYACKVVGVANIKISTLCKAIADDNNGIGVSRKTVERMIAKAKKLGLLTVYNTKKRNGGKGNNVYVFNKI